MEEQDKIYMALLRESKQCEREVVALKEKISRFSDSLNDVHLVLNGTFTPKDSPVGSPQSVERSLAGLPSYDEINLSVRELFSKRNRLKELSDSLSTMGI